MSMHSCQKFESLLSLFVNDELNPDQAVRVNAHLETCVECREKIKAYKQLAKRLAAIEPPVLPATLFDGFYEGIMNKIAVGNKIQSRLLGMAAIMHAHFWRRRLAFAAIVLAVVIAVSVLLIQRFRALPQPRTALIQMLEERNWPALYSAMLDHEFGSSLLDEPIPAGLLRLALIKLVQAQSQDWLVRAGLERVLSNLKTREGKPLGLGRSAQILGKVTAKGYEPPTRKNRAIWNPEASLQILLQSDANQTMTIRELFLKTTVKGNRL